MKGGFVAAFFFIFIYIQVINGEYSTEAILFKDLTENYGEKVSPKECTVYMTLAMACVTLYETSKIMTNRLAEVYVWFDGRLGWKPEEYEGLTEINIPEDLIWTPQLTILNIMMAPEREALDVVVSSSGWVTWFRPANYKMNYLTYSNDTDMAFLGRICYGSLTKTVDNLKLEFLGSGYENKYIPECQPYYVSKYRTRSSTLSIMNATYPQLEIEFIIQKHKF